MSCDRKQRGFTLAIAVFILVIMALIGAAMVSMMQNSQESVGSAVLSTRAFFAAQSGAQVTLASLFPLNGSAASCSASSPAITFTTSGLAGCSATVSCSSVSNAGKTYYTVHSTGVCGLSGQSASREIELMATNP